MSRYTWKEKLRRVEPHEHWVGVTLSAAAKKALGIQKARMPIACTADGVPFRTSAAPMGGEHCFVFTRALQEKTGRKAGDTVTFTVEEDKAPRTVEPPDDFRRALARNAAAKRNFAAFAFTHQREYVQWIESAKKPETRARRLAKAVLRIARDEKFS